MLETRNNADHEIKDNNLFGARIGISEARIGTRESGYHSIIARPRTKYTHVVNHS